MPTSRPPEWDEWVAQGARLNAAPPLRRNERTSNGARDPKFLFGDFLAGIPSQYIEALAVAIGEDPSSLRDYRDVATTFPPGHRVAASWSVHRNLRRRPELLRDGLTVREANVLLGGKPIDAKPDQRLSLEERAAKVREGLADPEVYALIDQELARSRNERKLRSRARQVVTEHSQRERELRNEIKELHEAQSAFEATVKVELQLNHATQLVHSIGETFTDLEQPERLISALTDLNLEIAKVLVAHQPPEETVDAPIVIDGEMWQARPARAALTDSNQRDLSRDGRTVIELIDDGPP